ncbi:MAG: carbamoyl-phosphate synthase large subunit, partial [Pseudomonadota bacterium]
AGVTLVISLSSFEPTIDYVVTKIPRFAFEKFPGAKPELTTAMKSVGEAMAIGRNFAESLQKALRSLETGLSGLDELEIADDAASETPEERREAIVATLSRPTPDRLRAAAQALREGFTVGEVHAATKFDPWFLERLDEIVAAEAELIRVGLPQDARAMRRLKGLGFADKRIAKLANRAEAEVRALRHALGVTPVFKRIDSCAGEVEALTPYMYSTYEADHLGAAECEAAPSDRTKIAILGGGPNRIGQGIEFDYCCCHACFALAEAGYETIMVNCNPETVSTDYDTSDRLYFEPLTIEDVLEILSVEQSKGTLKGVIVQFGGQTPLKLAQGLEDAGIPILGTSPDSIDLAEDRERFQSLLARLKLRQPANGVARSAPEAVAVAERLGYPLVIRPSFVLGGRGMEIVRDRAQLERYIKEAVAVSGDSPVLLDSYLSNAVEIDVDALSDGENVAVAGVMQHIEEAGVHSGDSACSLPPYSLSPGMIQEIEAQSKALAEGLEVVGLMNVQFAVKDDELFVLEANPRASRTAPFVAKAVGAPIAKIAARLMAGEPLSAFPAPVAPTGHVAVKEAVLPFARFPGVDTILGPEMRSTGEVMGLDASYPAAFLKSQIAAGVTLPREGAVFISVRDPDKEAAVEAARRLTAVGFEVVATSGTARALQAAGVAAKPVLKVHEGRPHIVDHMKNGEIALVFNTTEGAQSLKDSFDIRASALFLKIPYYTTAAGSLAAVRAIEAQDDAPLAVAPLQSYFRTS